MSNSSDQASSRTISKEKRSSDKISTTSSNNTNSEAKTSTQAYRPWYHQPSNNYRTSPNTSSTATISEQQQPTMSTTTSTRSSTSSTRGSSSLDSLKRPLISQNQRKSSVERAMDKARSKIGSRSGAEVLPNDELEFERQRAKAAEKQRRKEEYERLGLREKTKFGQPGGVSFSG